MADLVEQIQELDHLRVVLLLGTAGFNGVDISPAVVDPRKQDVDQLPVHVQLAGPKKVEDILEPVGQFTELVQVEEPTFPLDRVEHPEQAGQGRRVVRVGFEAEDQFLGLVEPFFRLGDKQSYRIVGTLVPGDGGGTVVSDRGGRLSDQGWRPAR